MPGTFGRGMSRDAGLGPGARRPLVTNRKSRRAEDSARRNKRKSSTGHKAIQVTCQTLQASNRRRGSVVPRPFPPERNTRGPRIRKRILTPSSKIEVGNDDRKRRRAAPTPFGEPKKREPSSMPLKLTPLARGTGPGRERRRRRSGNPERPYLVRVAGIWEAFFCQFARICWDGNERIGKTARSPTGERKVLRQDVPLLWQARWFWKEQFLEKNVRPCDRATCQWMRRTRQVSS